jgi:formylglycine-generating enzyme required for sulfatase activity
MKTYKATIGIIALLACSTALAADDAAEMKKLVAKHWTVPGIKLEMKLIPAGSFTMGSPKSEEHRRDDEVQHEVKISKPF